MKLIIPTLIAIATLAPAVALACPPVPQTLWREGAGGTCKPLPNQSFQPYSRDTSGAVWTDDSCTSFVLPNADYYWADVVQYWSNGVWVETMVPGRLTGTTCTEFWYVWMNQ